MQLRRDFPEHSDVTFHRVVSHSHSANGAAHFMLSAESDGMNRKICAIRGHSFGRGAQASSSASTGADGLSGPPIPGAGASHPPPSDSQPSTGTPRHPAPSRGTVHARERVQGGLTSRPPKRPRHAAAPTSASVPSSLDSPMSPYGIIAVNHVTRGQICSRGWGPEVSRASGLPRRPPFALRLLNAACCPCPVPAHLLSSECTIVCVDLAKAHSFGHKLRSDQPGHSLLSVRARWVHCDVVALALPSDQARPAP